MTSHGPLRIFSYVIAESVQFFEITRPVTPCRDSVVLCMFTVYYHSIQHSVPLLCTFALFSHFTPSLKWQGGYFLESLFWGPS